MAIDIIARGMAANAEGGGGGTTAWSDITGKPSTFPPSSHTHTTSDISDIDTAIESAIASSSAVSGIEDEVAALSSAVEDMEDMVVIADTSTAGLVKPDGMTITVGQDGTITAVGGSDNIYIATYGDTTVAHYTAMQAAANAGKPIFVKGFETVSNTGVQPCIPLTKHYTGSTLLLNKEFTFEGIYDGTRYVITCNKPSLVQWAKNSYTVGTGNENTSNKETNSIANPTSTSKYPSSKAVVDYVASQVPGVATSSSTGVVQPDGTTITVDANGVISASGGSGSDEVFIATYNSTTYEEIAAALAAGKEVLCDYPLLSDYTHEIFRCTGTKEEQLPGGTYASADFTNDYYKGGYYSSFFQVQWRSDTGNTTYGQVERQEKQTMYWKTNSGADLASRSSSSDYYTSNKAVVEYVASQITSGTSDLQDGVSPLATGAIYCYYTV